MASYKDTFESHSFAATSFACGAWRGTATDNTVGGPYSVREKEIYVPGAQQAEVNPGAQQAEVNSGGNIVVEITN